MKKIFALVLIGALTIALSACGNNMDGTNNNNTNTSGSDSPNATTTTVSAQAQTTPDDTGSGTADETEIGDAFTTT